MILAKTLVLRTFGLVGVFQERSGGLGKQWFFVCPNGLIIDPIFVKNGNGVDVLILQIPIHHQLFKVDKQLVSGKGGAGGIG